MVQTRKKYVEEPQERLGGTYRLPEDVSQEAVQILDDQLHQENDDLIWI